MTDINKSQKILEQIYTYSGNCKIQQVLKHESNRTKGNFTDKGKNENKNNNLPPKAYSWNWAVREHTNIIKKMLRVISQIFLDISTNMRQIWANCMFIQLHC